MLADTYNAFVLAFGQKFEELTFSQHADFCAGLAKAGLRQQDIYQAVFDKIKTLKDDRVISASDVYFPLLKGMADLNMVDTPLFEEVTSQEFIKQYLLREN